MHNIDSSRTPNIARMWREEPCKTARELNLPAERGYLDGKPYEFRINPDEARAFFRQLAEYMG